jgi:hypothetical protein
MPPKVYPNMTQWWDEQSSCINSPPILWCVLIGLSKFKRRLTKNKDLFDIWYHDLFIGII